MSAPNVLPSRRSREIFEKSPERRGREDVRYAETVGQTTQAHDTRAQAWAALQKMRQEALNEQVPQANLPYIHDRMSEPDIHAAIDSINKLRGLPTTAAASRAKAQAPAAAPLTPAIMQQPKPAAGLSPLTQAIMQPQGRVPNSPAPPMAFDAQPIYRTLPTESAPPSSDPYANLLKTPTGLQAPALRPDGSQMSNPDGTARFVGTLANKVPATVQSRVLDTGVGPTNARGETKMQTTGGPVVDVDPFKDLKTSWLAKGDPMLPAGADRGAVIDPKYRAPGGPAVGYGTGDDTARTAAMAATPKPAPAPRLQASPTSYSAGLTQKPSETVAMGGSAIPGALDPSIMQGVVPPAYAPPGQQPTGARALGAQINRSVTDAGAGAVVKAGNAGATAVDGVESAAAGTGHFFSGLLTGNATPPVDPAQEERKRKLASEPTPQFRGFGANSF